MLPIDECLSPAWRPSQQDEMLHAKDLSEPVQRSRVLRFAHSIEIHELPPDGRQIGDGRASR